jgi:hypothetical protein
MTTERKMRNEEDQEIHKHSEQIQIPRFEMDG